MPLKVTYYTDAPIDGVKECFEKMLKQEIEFVIKPFYKGGQTQTDITDDVSNNNIILNY